MHRGKGHERMCRPFRQLSTDRPPARYSHEGDGLYEGNLSRTSMSFINIKISTSKIRAADHGQSHLLPQIPYPLPIILPESASLRYRM